MSNIIVDCEAFGACPRKGLMTEFGAVDFDHYFKTGQWNTFHGVIVKSEPDPKNPAIPIPVEKPDDSHVVKIFTEFYGWMREIGKGTHKFWSDNPAYDFQWINDGFWWTMNQNPFGHSGRRIGDLFAGLDHHPTNTQGWKRWRETPHDHNPVHDAMGNAEGLAKILREFQVRI